MTPARPTVDVDGLAELLATHEPFGFSCRCGWRSESAKYASHHRTHVATVIAAHLAAVTAERDEARAAVERVERVADVLDGLGTTSVYESAAEIAAEIRAALDHVPATEGGEG